MVTDTIPSSTMPTEEPVLQEKDLGIILKELFQIYFKGFLKFVIPAAAVSAFTIMSLLSVKPTRSFFTGGIIINYGAILGYYVLSILLVLILYTLIIHITASYNINRNHFTGQTLIIASRRFLKVLGVFCLYLLIGIGCGLITFFFMIIPILGIVAAIVFLPLFIYWGIKWYFVIHAVVIEGAGPIHAFTRSSELVNDNWWRVFGITLLVGLIANIITLALTLIFKFLEPYSTIVAGAVAAPISCIASTLLYYDLRARNERCPLSKASLEIDPAYKPS